jgi:hypothetical protein
VVGAQAQRPSRAARACLLLVAVVTALAGLAVARARGPNWLAFSADPSYVYLLNGLNILEGDYPRHTDHPGTPTQLWMAALAWLTYAAGGAAGTPRGFVLGHPELVLGLFTLSGLGAFALATLSVGIAAHRLSQSLACAIGAQLAPALALVSLVALASATPEAMLLTIGTTLAAVLLRGLARPEDPPSLAHLAAIGLLAAVGLATKVTFLPVAVVALLLVPGRRGRVLVAVVGLVALASLLLPILPVAGQALRFLTAVTLHSGRYGRGAATVVDVGAYPKNLTALLRAEPLFAGMIVAGVGCLALTASARNRSLRAHRWWWALLAVTAAECLQIALVAKDPQVRHLTSAVSLAAVSVCLVYALAASACPNRRRALTVGLLLVLAVATGLQTRAVTALIRGLKQAKAAHLTVYEAARRVADGPGGGRVAVFYGSTSPAYAFHYGDELSGRRYSEDLRVLFPQAVFFALRTREFRRFGGEVVPATEVEEWLATAHAYFQGPREMLPRVFAYESVVDEEVEGLFRVQLR